MSTNQKGWFVTGANKGVGTAIIKEALASYAGFEKWQDVPTESNFEQ